MILGYIHNAFSRTPINCLDHVKDQWPRDGVLRVVISRNAAVSRLSENDTTRTNFTNSSITENIHVNISNLGVSNDNSSSVGDMYGHSSDTAPQKNHLPVRDTVVPSAFELLAPIKVEGRPSFVSVENEYRSFRPKPCLLGTVSPKLKSNSPGILM